MPQSPSEGVVAHWHQLVENFETSPQDFYTAVEAALERRKIPTYKSSRVKFSEGGILTANREYLRVTRLRHSFDLCAAPYGTGFFFSSWLTAKKPSAVFFWFLAYVGMAFAAFMLLERFGSAVIQPFTHGAVTLMIAAAVVVALLSLFLSSAVYSILARVGFDPPEAAIMVVPILGWIHEQLFAPSTYYKTDTMLMFQSAAQSAMHEVINGLLTAKGMRALNESEQKPVMQQLVDKKHTIADEQLVASR